MATACFDQAGRPTPEALAEERDLQETFPAYRGVDPDYVHAGREALERWWDWKFGIRIHWSIYSVTGNGPESWPLTRADLGASPEFREQYEGLYEWWNPSRFDAGEWCDLLVRAGLRFFTFTAKHHDGFSMYDTKTKVKRRLVHTGDGAGRIRDCDLRYCIVDTPFARDVVGELVAAARARGLGVGLYFSHIDWFDSDFRLDEWNYQRDETYTRESDPEGFARMIGRHREQVRELCANYGEIDLLSLDMHFPESSGIRDEIIQTIKAARRLQPRMLVRRRGIDPYGDYKTPERVVPADPQAAAGGQDMPWQVIYPGGKHFSHVWADEYKPAGWIVANLVDVAAKGGNFQVGYGPMPDGSWAPGVVRRLEEVGRWLAVNGEGVYNTRPFRTFREGEHVRFTQTKDGRYVYAFVLKRGAPPFGGGRIRLESVRARPGSRIEMLGLDHAFRYSQDEDALCIEVPEWLRGPERLPSEHAWAFRIETDVQQDIRGT